MSIVCFPSCEKSHDAGAIALFGTETTTTVDEATYRTVPQNRMKDE